MRAISLGQRDPRELAKLRDPHIRASEEEIAHSLEGNWQKDVLFVMQLAVDAYDFHRRRGWNGISAAEGRQQREGDQAEEAAVRQPGGNGIAQRSRIAGGSDSYLGARYRYYTGHLEGLKGVKAMAHYPALLVYRLLTKGPAWLDRGAAYFENKRKQREMVGLQRKAAALGMQLLPTT